jgi:1-phosphofructokinase family hexose kinase
MIYTLTLNPALDMELCVGELILDEVLRATATQVDCGGKGFNVSRALAALGEPSVAMGFLGGKTGERLTEMLSQLGIAGDFVFVAGETRTNVSIVTAPAMHYIKVNEPGPVIDGKAYAQLIQKVRDQAQAGDWWVLSGSLPPGLGAASYAELIETTRASGAKAVLDSSGEALRLGCRAKPTLAKPNALEASQVTGLAVENLSDAQHAAAALNMGGVELALVSLGKDGAVLAYQGTIWLATPPRIVESNPIGAGDALTAGFVYGLKHDLPLPEALRFGVACGAAAASLPGTRMGTREMVDKMAGQVTILTLT